jgi:hypothetical protein
MPDLLATRFLVQTFGIDMTQHDAFNDMVLQSLLHSSTLFATLH